MSQYAKSFFSSDVDHLSFFNFYQHNKARGIPQIRELSLSAVLIPTYKCFRRCSYNGHAQLLLSIYPLVYVAINMSDLVVVISFDFKRWHRCNVDKNRSTEYNNLVLFIAMSNTFFRIFPPNSLCFNKVQK